VRQRLRADFNDDAFRPLDLLLRDEESRIALERGKNGLVKREAAHATC
jgi:hypothetical protein